MQRLALSVVLIGVGAATVSAQPAEQQPVQVVDHSQLEGGAAEASVEGEAEVSLGWLGLVFDVELLGVGIYAPPARGQINLALFIALAWHPWLEIGLHTGTYGVIPRTDTTYRVGGQVRVNVPLGLGRKNLERFIAIGLGGGVHMAAPDEGSPPVADTLGPWGTAAVMMRWIDLSPVRESRGAPWTARVGMALGLRYHFLYGGDPELLGRDRGHAVVAFFSFALSLERF
jgi:hypothetical protein